jgi:DNA polymerase-3 subunit delta'
MVQLAEPRHFLLRRGPNDKGTALAQVISVDEVRKMKSFFTLTAADGGRRTAIVDSLDEMNPNAANALLKLLEEPPDNVTLFLVAHQPARLLPTIRSRCRELRLGPLGAGDLAAALAAAGGDVAPGDRAALAELSGGSVGEAFRMTNLDGLALYASLVRLCATLPRMDRPQALALAELAAARGASETFDLLVTLIETLLARLARFGTTGASLPEAAPGEAQVLARLSPDPGAGRAWAGLAQALAARARRGKAVNLDPAALLMDMLLKVDETAGTLAAR